MNEKRYNEIVFCRDRYDNNDNMMFEEIGRCLNILLTNDYVAIVRYDEPSLGVVVIEYEHNEEFCRFGVPNPEWITEEEKNKIFND